LYVSADWLFIALGLVTLTAGVLVYLAWSGRPAGTDPAEA
jgi:hypothetical protein